MNVSRTTFRALFVHGGRIEIPAIQRDYAQGRDDEHSAEVRRRFLATLHDALAPTADAAASLDLDFVYGRRQDDGRTLQPLDGQQRLTTLFLLHWYLASLEGTFDEFRSWVVVPGRGSSFSYRTRESAREFLDALVERPAPVRDLARTPYAVSAWLVDAVWFVRSWLRDPTVRACLRMLDAIHEKFASSSGAWARLTSLDSPAVTFRLLPLDDFELSDELYVKMNARGKALTPFEVFKAELEQFVAETLGNNEGPFEQGLGWRDYVARQLDTTWADFLWKHHYGTRQIDSRFMHLVRALAFVRCVDRADEERLPEQIAALLSTPSPTLQAYTEIGCLDEEFIDDLTLFLDTLSEAGDPAFVRDAAYLDERALFRRVLLARGANETEGLTLVDWVLFYAWCTFVLRFANELSTDACRAAFHHWMRLVANLARNSDIDRTERLVAALGATRALAQHAGPELLTRVAAGALEDAGGFNHQQRREERLKARLVLRDAAWRTLLERAETHAYFEGDVEFLLRFSGVFDRATALGGCTWDNPEDGALRNAFAECYARAAAVFPESGGGVASFPGLLWERALLATGDYLLPRGRNRSFLVTKGGDATWKRLLRADTKVTDRDSRRDVVRRVLERVNPADAAASLRSIVTEGATGTDPAQPGLRSRLVAEPRLLEYCGSREIRYEDGTVYLLSKVQRNGRHVDVYVYDLYLKLAGRPLELAPFSLPMLYEPTDSYARSQLRLESWLLGPRLEVIHHHGRFVFQIAAAPQDPILAANLADWSSEGEGSFHRAVPLDDAEADVVKLAAVLRDVRSRLAHGANAPLPPEALKAT